MPGQDEVGPAARERRGTSRSRARRSACSASARTRRVGRGLVAGDDQQPDRLGVRALLVAGRGPGVGDAAAVRRRRQVEGAAAGPVGEAELARERGERARRPRPPSPDQIRTARSLSRRRLPSASRLSASRAAALDRRRRRARPRRRARRAALIQRSTTGARSTTGSSPSTTTSSRVADRGERQRGTRRARRVVSSGSTAVCAPRPCAHEPRERVGLLDRLRARERGHDRGRPASRSSRSASSSASSQRDLLEAARAARAGAGRDPVVGVQVRRSAKRPLSQSQPSSTSGWLRERIRLTLPSRVVALMLQPTGQRPQTVGHVLDLPRPRLEAVLRRGQRADRAELDHVAGERRAVGLVLERRDHRLRAAVDARRAGRPRRRSSEKRVQR